MNYGDCKNYNWRKIATNIILIILREKRVTLYLQTLQHIIVQGCQSSSNCRNSSFFFFFPADFLFFFKTAWNANKTWIKFEPWTLASGTMAYDMWFASITRSRYGRRVHYFSPSKKFQALEPFAAGIPEYLNMQIFDVFGKMLFLSKIIKNYFISSGFLSKHFQMM